VETKTGFLGLARKVCFFALFGFLAIALTGPILAALSLVLSFALVGFVLWLPVHALLRRNGKGWRTGVAQLQGIARRGGRILAGVWSGTLHLARDAHAALRGTASFLGAVLLESLSGALVAVLLVSTAWPPHNLAPGTLVLAGLAGAAVGLLVVLARRGAASEPVASQSPEGVN
jgi:hypothetical protein